MRSAFVALAFGAVATGSVVRADEPPASVTPDISPPARPGPGRGRGQWDDPRFLEDRKWFHFLLDNRAKIRRTIERLPDGVKTVTESDDADVVSAFIEHGHEEVRKNHPVPPRAK